MYPGVKRTANDVGDHPVAFEHTELAASSSNNDVGKFMRSLYH